MRFSGRYFCRRAGLLRQRAVGFVAGQALERHVVGFVEGHGFTRAVSDQKRTGFSPCEWIKIRSAKKTVSLVT
jgi:hypothetical protein